MSLHNWVMLYILYSESKYCPSKFWYILLVNTLGFFVESVMSSSFNKTLLFFDAYIFLFLALTIEHPGPCLSVGSIEVLYLFLTSVEMPLLVQFLWYNFGWAVSRFLKLKIKGESRELLLNGYKISLRMMKMFGN